MLVRIARAVPTPRGWRRTPRGEPEASLGAAVPFKGGGFFPEQGMATLDFEQTFGGDKPIYVITSKRTASGGEELAYDLKSLGRAVLVGETTAGAANPTGPPFEFDEWFRIFVPWARPVNPITKSLPARSISSVM